MGYFYNPPPPSQGRSNSTPPLPHVAIATGGSQPPLRQVGTVLAMVAVLASWPADQEPRLQRPNNQRQISAALLPPPPVPIPVRGPVSKPIHAQLIASWPPDAPLPVRPEQAVFPGIVVAPPYVPNPQAGRIYPAILSALLEDAAADVEVVPTFVVAPDNPDAPPLRQPSSLGQRIASAWEVSWSAQEPPQGTAWVVPPIVATFVPRTPPPALIWSAWADPLPVPRAGVFRVQPGTDQPPTRQPIPLVQRIAGAWDQPWSAQEPPQGTAWYVPPVVSVYIPRTAPPSWIWSAWEPLAPMPPRPIRIAPLTLTYGGQPPPQSALSVQKMAQAASAWAQTWNAQTEAPVAAWYVAPPPGVFFRRTQFYRLGGRGAGRR